MSYEPFKNPRDTMDFFTKLNAAKTAIEAEKTAQEAKKQTKLMEEQNRLLREQLKSKEQKQNEQGINSGTKPATTSSTYRSSYSPGTSRASSSYSTTSSTYRSSYSSPRTSRTNGSYSSSYDPNKDPVSRSNHTTFQLFCKSHHGLVVGLTSFVISGICAIMLGIMLIYNVMELDSNETYSKFIPTMYFVVATIIGTPFFILAYIIHLYRY